MPDRRNHDLPPTETVTPRPEVQDDLRDLLRQTRRHLRERGAIHPRTPREMATPRARPEALREPIAVGDPQGEGIEDDDPSYVAWSAAVVGVLFATGLVVGLLTLWFMPVEPPRTGFAYAWPWGLVAFGALAAGLSIASQAWPERPDVAPPWTKAVAGGLAAMLLSIGFLGVLWFLRVLTAG